jgi:hypothetical protein
VLRPLAAGRIGGLVLLASLLLASQALGSAASDQRSSAAASAAAPLPATIAVEIDDHARIPRAILSRAAARAAAAFRAVQVRTDWARRMPPGEANSVLEDGCEPVDAPRVELRIVIPSRRVTERLDQADWLGIALHGEGGVPARLAYVFYTRVEAAAHATGADTGDVLGYVLAHEVAHLLLPPAWHSPRGIMRSEWRRVDLLGLGACMRFSEDEGQSLRAGLAEALDNSP